jgi:hypothetical protein
MPPALLLPLPLLADYDTPHHPLIAITLFMIFISGCHCQPIRRWPLYFHAG